MGDTSEVDWIYLDGDDILGMFLSSSAPSLLMKDYDHAGDAWNNVTHYDGWPSFGLRFSGGTDERVILEKLVRASHAPQYSGKFHVYTTESYAGGKHLQTWRTNKSFLYRVSPRSDTHAPTLPFFRKRADCPYLGRSNIRVCIDKQEDGSRWNEHWCKLSTLYYTVC